MQLDPFSLAVSLWVLVGRGNNYHPPVDLMDHAAAIWRMVWPCHLCTMGMKNVKSAKEIDCTTKVLLHFFPPVCHLP
jgi:hypothetical protein